MSKLIVALVAFFALVATAAAGKKQYMLAISRCTESAPWSLHGLWPQEAMDCPGEKFDVKKLAPIRAQLDIDWLSCPGHKTNPEFWNHEWTKHGTCTGWPMLEYFNRTMALLHEHQGLCKRGPFAEGSTGADMPPDCRILLGDDLKPVKKVAQFGVNIQL